MTPQLDNKLISSFLLMLDHVIQKNGQAFTNTSGLFYPIASNIKSLYAYASPYKQLCNDISISGANVLSGVYLNNNFVTVGQSGLAAINHYQGTLYFTGALPSQTVVSGNYGIKDFNIELSDQPEWKVLFDTKFVSNRTYNQTLSGLALDTKTCPSIFVRTKVQDTKPFALGGIDNSEIRLRTIIVADNEYSKIAAANILKNMNYHPLPVVLSTSFNSLGAMTGINYNYETLSTDPDIYPWILRVRVIDIPPEGQYQNMIRNMVMADFDISVIIRHSY